MPSKLAAEKSDPNAPAAAGLMVGGTAVNEEMLGQMEVLLTAIQRRSQDCEAACKGETIPLKHLGRSGVVCAAVGIPTGMKLEGIPVAIPVGGSLKQMGEKMACDGQILDCTSLIAPACYSVGGQEKKGFEIGSEACSDAPKVVGDQGANPAVEDTDAPGKKGEKEEEELVFVTKDKFHTAGCRYAKTGPTARKVPRTMAVDVLLCKPCKLCCK
jgi:hypothetical protein